MDTGTLTIGIVGGVGPEAGLDLCRKITSQTLAHTDQEHLSLILASLPGIIPDRTEFLDGISDKNPAPGILDAISRLVAGGAAIIGIPCNTSHAAPIMDVVRAGLGQQAPDVRLVNMIETVREAIVKRFPGIVRIGVLATNGTIRADVYGRVLRPSGYEVIYPADEIQNEHVHTAIYHPVHGIKAGGSYHEFASTRILRAVHHLGSQGAELIILGCTELPLVIRDEAVGKLPVIDSTLELARALIHHAAPDKLRHNRTPS